MNRRQAESSVTPSLPAFRTSALAALWLFGTACGGTVECQADPGDSEPDSCLGPSCSCPAGRGDCDGDPGNGCEADLASSTDHCGGCGQLCSHGSCEQGSCVCRDGFADCDALPANGCETDLRLDALHCGSCGHGCGGGPCVAGQCSPEAIATGLTEPIFVAVGTERVFWTDLDLEGIWTASKDGSEPATIVLPEPWVQDLAVDGDRVYWLTSEGLWRLDSVTDPSPQLVAASPAGRALHLGSTDAYWVTTDDGLQRAPKLGNSGPVQTLAEQVITIALTETYLYWFAYEGYTTTGSVLRRDLTTGTATTIASGLDTCYSLAARGTDVYCVTEQTLLALSDPGAPPVQLTAFGYGSTPLDIIVDDDALYWLGDGGAITRLDRTGGSPVALATDQCGVHAYGLAQDADWLYWPTTTQVVRLFKQP